MCIASCKVKKYLNETHYITLATVNEKLEPVQRTLGAFAVEGTTTYFSTSAGTAKVAQIAANPSVSILFQHEAQKLPQFVNVAINGKAQRVTDEAEVQKTIALISARVPKFRERAELGNLKDSLFFRIDPSEATIIDFSKGFGPAAVEKISFPAA